MLDVSLETFWASSTRHICLEHCRCQEEMGERKFQSTSNSIYFKSAKRHIRTQIWKRSWRFVRIVCQMGGEINPRNEISFSYRMASSIGMLVFVCFHLTTNHFFSESNIKNGHAGHWSNGKWNQIGTKWFEGTSGRKQTFEDAVGSIQRRKIDVLFKT